MQFVVLGAVLALVASTVGRSAPSSAATRRAPSRYRRTQATVGTGTNIGNATELTGSASGSLASVNADDWYVVYPATAGGAVTIKVSNTTASPTPACENLLVVFDNTDGNAVQSANVLLNQNTDPTFSSPVSDRYFVELSLDCNPDPGHPVTYQVELQSGGGGAAPNPASGSIEASASIDAGPPLQGATSYTGSLPSNIADDWYVLDKHDDTTSATVRVENTTVKGSSACTTSYAIFRNTDGNALQSATLVINKAHTFSEATPGRYFVELYDSCAQGATSYRIEPESKKEWDDPPRLAPDSFSSGSTLATAGGPLAGGVDYQGRLVDSTTRDWFSVETNGRGPVIVSVDDTTLKISDCSTIYVIETNENGNAIASATLPDDMGHEFDLTAVGATYYFEVYSDCDPGTSPPQTYDVSITPPDAVNPRPQRITFTTTPPPAPVPGDTYKVAAKASSGLPVVLTVDPTSSTMCTISGSASPAVVTFTDAGGCIIDANQPGNAKWEPAPQAEQRIAVTDVCGIAAGVATPGAETLPIAVTTRGWSLNYQFTASKGLQVTNVKLKSRTLATSMSTASVTVTANGHAYSIALTPARRIAWQHHKLAGGGLFLLARYAASYGGGASRGCITVTQQYDFEPQLPGDRCEPSGSVACARFYPETSYEIAPGAGGFSTVRIVEQLALCPDCPRPPTRGVFQDCDFLPNCLIGPSKDNPIFSNKINPIRGALKTTRVISRGQAGKFDNLHETSYPTHGKIQEPLKDGALAGCPTCVHIHWRWGTLAAPPALLNGFSDYNGARPRIPPGSTQDVDIAVASNGTLTYTGTGHQPFDTFFEHGGWFDPVLQPPKGSTTDASADRVFRAWLQ